MTYPLPEEHNVYTTGEEEEEEEEEFIQDRTRARA
jgi:hypothetical protein